MSLSTDSVNLARLCRNMKRRHKVGTWPKYDSMRTDLVQMLGEVAYLLETGAREMEVANAVHAEESRGRRQAA